MGEPNIIDPIETVRELTQVKIPDDEGRLSVVEWPEAHLPLLVTTVLGAFNRSSQHLRCGGGNETSDSRPLKW